MKTMHCKKKTIAWGSIATFLVVIFTSGCASMAHKKELTEFNALYSAGSYQKAADMQLKQKGDKKSDSSKLLESLQAATALRFSKKYKQSSSIFDECEDIIKVHNEEAATTDVASNVAAILVNDAFLDYRGAEYDGVMINTYKALNFWQVGENDLARIEFNRALDRQRRAKERFASEIAKQEETLKKKQEDSPKIDIDKNVNNPEIDKILQNKYSNLYAFKAYPDFINPFTTYMAGLFFMSEGDHKKAVDLLKEAYGMMDKNAFVASDFASVENTLSGKKENKKFTWVIFENGLGPIKEEFRIDLPILLLTKKVKYTGIALPKLKMRKQAFPHLVIKNGGDKIAKTSILSSMDRVVQTEFKMKYTATVTRAVVSTLIKTFAQYGAQKQLGNVGGFATGLYQAATTAADIRIWTALPKEFQLAKIETPSNGLLNIETPAGNVVKVKVPQNRNSLVYVKIPTNKAKIIYDVIKM
ncbi:MAG: hypothetical protein HFP77_02025 [Methylococcales symbiont of Iophon sp. n. MRB-2018]|nr:MAG: hypothetical protein HFP77_02025 [Methylococcales symbiont of Iophon sp. n. MRB-2018]KAF3979555.1 MAG: hypothetical protein HFP76_06440 [Methylococcales symbiont of Iophon sp. n. MRB-2018]